MSTFFVTQTFAQNMKSEQVTMGSSRTKVDTSGEMLDMGPGAIPVLRENIGSSDTSLQVESIRLLGELGAKEAVPDLLEFIARSEDHRSVLVSMYALGLMQDIRATSYLISTASSVSTDPYRRRGAIVSLGLLGDKRAIPTLEKILLDDKEMLQIFAAGSLGMLGSDAGLSIALQGMKSEDPSIRLHAIQALGLIGSEVALDALDEKHQMYPTMVEKQTIEMAIFQIDLKQLPTEERILTIEEKILSIPKRTAISRWCTNELRRIGGPNAGSSLKKIAELHPDAQVRLWANRKKKALDISENMKGQDADETQ